MQQDQLLSNNRWEIIKAISMGKASATELAELTKSTLPNVSQQLKLLEAYDFVEYIKDQKRAQGKPRQLYALKKEICHLTYARHGMAEKRLFNPDPYHVMLLNILFIPSLQDHAYLIKHLSINDEIFSKCAVAYLKSTDVEIDVLLVTDDVEQIRTKYSNSFVEHNGKTRKIIAWTHSIKDIHDGLARKEPYFEGLMKNPITIHDPKGIIEKAKK